MLKAKDKSFGYHFLNKSLHPSFPNDYRVSIILLIVNKNKSENTNKFLIVQQASKIWGLPKEGTKSKITVEDLYTTVARNLELELGFRGIKVVETKPLFKQVGLIFDFDKQDYEAIRSKQEVEKGRPSKGKIYLLAIMEYRGPDKLPFVPNVELTDYKWINEKEWLEYEDNNFKTSKQDSLSLKTAKFASHLVIKSLRTYRSIEDPLLVTFDKKNTLF